MENQNRTQLCGQEISQEVPPFVIAELSANHNGNLDRAKEIVRRAAAAGANAVKLQHYTPETLTIRSPLPEFRISGGTPWDGKELFDLYREAMTPWEWTEEIVNECDASNIAWFSSPFDNSAVDFLEELGMPAYKVASFEIVDLPLIRYMAATGKPMVISTGMATVEEIDRAVATAVEGGCEQVILLRCNSSYPSKPDEMDLKAIPFMRDRYGCEVGLSDHTIGSTAAIVATALGATIFEKHITLEHEVDGVDDQFSADSDEFANFVINVRQAREALGHPRFGPSSHERSSVLFRRSLRTTRRIGAGEIISHGDIRSMRPAGGLEPDLIDQVIGCTALVDLEIGSPLTWSDLR